MTHTAIQEAAYLRWEAAGRPEGREMDFWLAAEREASVPEGVELVVQGENGAPLSKDEHPRLAPAPSAKTGRVSTDALLRTR